MKNRKTHMMLLFAGMTIFALTGCTSKMTAEKLVNEVITASQEKAATEVTSEMAFDMSMTAEGVSMDIELEVISDSQVSYDPYVSYSDTALKMSIAGQETNTNTEIYSSLEDGMITNYTYVEATDTWTKEEVEMDDETTDALLSNMTGFSDMKDIAFTLDEETQTVDNQEVYVLSGILTGDMINDTLSQLGNFESLLGTEENIEFDFSSLTIPTTYYISTTTFLPVQIEMNIDGMGDMMNSLIASMLGDESAALGMTLDIGTVSMVMKNISYDPVDVPTVPESALYAILMESFEQDLGDGSYVLWDSGDAARITAPNGCELSSLTNTSIVFMNNAGTQMISFNLYYNFTAEDFTYSMEDGVLENFKLTGYYSDHGFDTVKTAGDAAWFKFTDGSSAYYTWLPVGENSYLLIECLDTSGLDLIEALEPLTTLVEDYDLGI